MYIQAFDAWFAKLMPKERDEMTRKFRQRQIMKKTILQRKEVLDCKQWECVHCTLMNRTIWVENRERVPKNICMCCGNKNGAKNVLLRTQTLMPNHFKHSQRRKSSMGHNTFGSVDSSKSDLVQKNGMKMTWMS